MATGAVAGALARWRLSSTGHSPWLTVAAINVAGSLALGVCAGRWGGGGVESRPRLLLLAGTGFLGSFTTFSTFSLDTVLLLHQGHAGRALGVAVGTPALGIGAAALGLAAGRRLVQRAGV